MKDLINRLLGLFKKEVRSMHAPLQTFEKGMQALSKVIHVETVVDVGVAQGTPELYSAFRGKKFLLIEANPVFAKEVETVARNIGAAYEMLFVELRRAASLCMFLTVREVQLCTAARTKLRRVSMYL